jgi:serine protease Do
LGMTLKTLTAEDATALGMPADSAGLAVVEIDEMSEAFTKGLRVGDVITEAGQQKVMTVKDLQDREDEARSAGRKSLLLLIRRGGDPRFVAIAIDK